MKQPLVLSLFVIYSATAFGQAARNLEIETDCRNVIKSIETINSYKASIKIAIPHLMVEDVEIEGITYQKITIDGFSYSCEVGNPELPLLQFSLIVPPGTEPKIKILNKEDTIIENVNIVPKLKRGLISSDHRIEPNTPRNEAIYSSNTFYPSEIAVVKETAVYRGNEIAFFKIYPVSFNPVSKKIHLSNNLEILVTMVPVLSKENHTVHGSFSGEEPMRICYSSAVGGLTKTSTSQVIVNDADSTVDIIIITIPALKPAADTLALWHTMKGYETKVVTSSTWETSRIKDSVTYYYKKAKPAPNYLLIIGDKDQVPLMTITEYDETAYLDFNYVLMDGSSDKIPDLARGRIPANNISEAYAAIRKIIKYEKMPPANSSFYNNVLAASCFQADDGSTTNESKDYRFSKTIEDARAYLVKKSYNVTRAYVAQSSNLTPEKWWNGNSLVDIPNELQKPQFGWNANGTIINSSINSGVFLAYHYDHGYEKGWSDPDWSVENMTLNNKDMLPVVYSINCQTGSLQHSSKCFAEKLILSESGGAVGIIAASAVTYADPNIVLIKGLIEVTWPGYADDGRNELPVYTLGDILDKSLVRIENLDDFTKKEYLLFGDPTTKIYTKEPSKITVSHGSNIHKNAKSFSLTGLSVKSGIVTLVDKKTSKCYGKAQIQGSTVNVTVNNAIPDNASLVVTISNDNYSTYQSDLKTVNTSIQDNVLRNYKNSVLLKIEKLPSIVVERSELVSLKIYNLQGKLIYKTQIKNLFENTIISNCLNANGTYCVNVHYENSNRDFISKLVWKE